MIKTIKNAPTGSCATRDPRDGEGSPQTDERAASAFEPRPIQGDASFGYLLTHQRRAQAEQRQCHGLDEETAALLPLLLSLARLSARATVQGSGQ